MSRGHELGLRGAAEVRRVQRRLHRLPRVRGAGGASEGLEKPAVLAMGVLGVVEIWDP